MVVLMDGGGLLRAELTPFNLKVSCQRAYADLLSTGLIPEDETASVPNLELFSL